MSTSNSFSPADAHQLLSQWDCLSEQPDTGLYGQLRDALRTVVEHSDYQILGVCAGSLREGHRALMTYAEALDYPVDDSALPLNMEEAIAPHSTYIKYNPTSGLLYASDYEGRHRGVLVSCQSETTEGINEMYGHLPLDLFA